MCSTTQAWTTRLKSFPFLWFKQRANELTDWPMIDRPAILPNSSFFNHQRSLLHRTWLTSTSSRTMFDFVANRRKGSLYLYKDELGSWPISSIVSTSPKQYVILELPQDLELPVPDDIIPELTTLKKAKGVHRGLIAEQLSKDDYISVGVLGHESRRVSQYGFKKHLFSIFLNKTKRVLLSRGNSKRIFCACSRRNNESFFSLPLFVRRLPD